MEKIQSRFNKIILALTATALTCISAAAIAGPTLDTMNTITPAPAIKAAAPGQQILIPAAPQLNVKGYVLMDANSGNIIASQNGDTQLPPASLTKLMTLYVVSSALRSGQIHLDDMVTVSKKAWQTGGSRMFINVGQQVSVQDLLKGVIVDSGNDATVALAEYVAGSEDAFTSLMNQEAQRLGMTNSHFTDCNGLPHPEHYVSAHDMAILAQHIINEFPEYYGWYSQKEFTFNNITQSNRNRLLWRYQYADGMKTGHTDDAGFCLIASAKQDGMRLISVVLGAPSDSARAADSISLLTYGFRFYKTYKLYTAGETITDVRVWKGQNKRIPVGVSNNIYITLPIGQYEKLAAQSAMSSPINAPIAKGQQLGVLDITVGDKSLMQVPLVALQDSPKGSYWSQLTDKVSLSLHNMFKKKKADTGTTTTLASKPAETSTTTSAAAVAPAASATPVTNPATPVTVANTAAAS
jgi:D-alanyl-D-alanine carboxypeptidase (penicillin-binding protein 5/6)